MTQREQKLADAAEMLWVVLANVSGGDWTKQTPEWQETAARWRDNYFAALAASPVVTTQPDAPCGHGWHWGAKCDEPAKPEAGPMRNAESPSGVQALGSSGLSQSAVIPSVEEAEHELTVAIDGLLEYSATQSNNAEMGLQRGRRVDVARRALIRAVQQASHAEIERLNRRMSELSDANVRLSTLYDAEVANRVERVEQAQQAGEVLTQLDARIRAKVTPALNTGTAMELMILVADAMREQRAVLAPAPPVTSEDEP